MDRRTARRQATLELSEIARAVTLVHLRSGTPDDRRRAAAFLALADELRWRYHPEERPTSPPDHDPAQLPLFESEPPA